VNVERVEALRPGESTDDDLSESRRGFKEKPPLGGPHGDFDEVGGQG